VADLLYLWPAAAEFGSRVPEGKFFDHPAFTPAVREKFASEVQCVTWRYKLAKATIRRYHNGQLLLILEARQVLATRLQLNVQGLSQVSLSQGRG